MATQSFTAGEEHWGYFEGAEEVQRLLAGNLADKMRYCWRDSRSHLTHALVLRSVGDFVGAGPWFYDLGSKVE